VATLHADGQPGEALQPLVDLQDGLGVLPVVGQMLLHRVNATPLDGGATDVTLGEAPPLQVGILVWGEKEVRRGWVGTGISARIFVLFAQTCLDRRGLYIRQRRYQGTNMKQKVEYGEKKGEWEPIRVEKK
jgi:hypothetical protein